MRWRRSLTGGSWIRRITIAGITVLALAVVITGGFGIALLTQAAGSVSPRAHSTGEDALWLGGSWLNGGEDKAAVTALAARLRGTGIRDLFVRTGPLSASGSIEPAQDSQARWLIETLHRDLPRIRVQAWLRYSSSGQKPSLADVTTQDQIAASVRLLLSDGFAGVLLDLQPVSTGSAGYLATLRLLRAVTSTEGKMLSVTAAQVEPLSAMHVLSPGHWWTARYLRQVAALVNEVVLMTYDSGLPTGQLYAGYVRRETQLALTAVPARDTLLVGLPAFRIGHQDHVRGSGTMAEGIRGVRLALGPDPRRNLGVALYAGFSPTSASWHAYHQDWQSPTP